MIVGQKKEGRKEDDSYKRKRWKERICNLSDGFTAWLLLATAAASGDESLRGGPGKGQDWGEVTGRDESPVISPPPFSHSVYLIGNGD
ncbi:hypothetical protein LOAG_00903 [Loa loa]|uniref:Uncharacterized protein n=1 Tax=Loa loa TaxID=7209 RepID=A0A1S0UAP7_LOALO|nr:hypothetical protein LOAG_00903 [Loa loa]EFO27584.2 hypothetical protein LOAG_00903 [Loa loa]